MPKLSFTKSTVLSRKPIPGRMNTFVLVPGTPKFPTAHPGSDNTICFDRPMDADHQEYLALGESTIHTLMESGGSGGRVCPRVLFLCSTTEGFDNEGLEEAEGLGEAYRPHRLATYADHIMEERQLPLNIHIAAHGDSKKIGSITLDFRMKIEDFADTIASFLVFHLGKDAASCFKEAVTVKSQEKPRVPRVPRAINFTFHSCNSAFAPTCAGMPDAVIADLIRTESLIGKFKNVMNENGYTNITVSGFRGFYTHGVTHKASFVSSSLAEGCLSVPAEKTKFFIAADGKVTIPTKPHFPVELPGFDSRPHLVAECGLFATRAALVGEPEGSAASVSVLRK